MSAASPHPRLLALCKASDKLGSPLRIFGSIGIFFFALMVAIPFVVMTVLFICVPSLISSVGFLMLVSGASAIGHAWILFRKETKEPATTEKEN